MGLNQKFCEEIYSELLNNILDYWIKNTIDDVNGGFIGQISDNNRINNKASKGVILNSRILWTFSAAYNQLEDEKYLKIADRAYEYFTSNFVDKEYGGVFWMLDFMGNSNDSQKQVYAQAFAIYAFSEYYKATQKKEALQHAKNIYELIEEHSFEPKYNGYVDAFTREWEEKATSNISPDVAKGLKTMNTHLHILEAYTNFYSVWKDDKLGNQLKNLIEIHLQKIIDKPTGHFNLFFDREWNCTSDFFSYGHDIEGAWLMRRAAQVIDDSTLLKQVEKAGDKIAEITLKEGISEENGVLYEGNLTQVLNPEKHWWPQAEGMVGFLDTYEHTKNEEYLQMVYKIWEFTKKYIVNPSGEWFWLVDEKNKTNSKQDKVGPWKGPYHNARACLELLSRLECVLVG